MRLRRLLPVLMVAGFSAFLPSCGQEAVILPTGEQRVIGTLEQAPFSSIRRGTHVLSQDGEDVYFVESLTLNLRTYEGKEVELVGTLEHNSDPSALPVLVVSQVLSSAVDGARSWTIPLLSLTMTTPAVWNANIEQDTVRFTASGSAKTTLIVTAVQQSDAVFTASANAAFTVGSRRAVRVPGDRVDTVFLERQPGGSGTVPVLRFTFDTALSPDDGVRERLEKSIVSSVVFKGDSASSRSSASSRPQSSASGSTGMPCGGPAGILCPAGQYCNITDLTTDSGRCRAW